VKLGKRVAKNEPTRAVKTQLEHVNLEMAAVVKGKGCKIRNIKRPKGAIKITVN
jgi:hypothetical protein